MTSVARAKTEHPRRKLRWPARQRQKFIDDHLQIATTIRRERITEVFGVCTATASTDLRWWQRTHPGKLYYDKSDKLYRLKAVAR